ncbi:hypothetical protein EC973_008277 [Apophysomyces ossiformis]|uniref:F-box domain-containing protein n=1 Tax=Apophysomyces ossiformis TaxID=679940 RepID=A0A8H7BV52_9FUNG|nr:hypothetical protein EC973_008277 [Apophysomyces ossiformis]
MTRPWSPQLPVLPNELLMQVILFTNPKDLVSFLFVCRYTYQLVCQRVYRRVIFPDTVGLTDIVGFCQKYGLSLETIKLPKAHHYSDNFFVMLLQLCPKLAFLQSSMTPKQLLRLRPSIRPSACFMLTYVPTSFDLGDQYNLAALPCCSSYFAFPNHHQTTTLTHISHYFHHPGALRNAILPTFGADLLSLNLNPYDVVTAAVASMIAQKCPRLRYLAAPAVKAEGLWMLLRWCHTLVAILVGGDQSDDEDEDDTAARQARRMLRNQENEQSVATIENHKRVWCVHPHTRRMLNEPDCKSWHIGILPKV